MKVGLATQGAEPLQKPLETAADAVARTRQEAQADVSSASAENKIPQEEILSKVKALLSGSYSVRFEMDQNAMKVVIRLVDNKSGAVVGQIPPEEFLKMAQILQHPKGQLMRTKS